MAHSNNLRRTSGTTGLTKKSGIHEDVVRRVASLFSLLDDPTRIKVILAVADGEKCVGDIAKEVNSSDSAVSHQLRILRDSRVVDYRKEGRMSMYRLCDDHIKNILEQSLDHARE